MRTIFWGSPYFPCLQYFFVATKNHFTMHCTRCLLILGFLAMFVLLHFHLEIHCSQSLSLSKMKFSTNVCTCACPCVGRWVWAGLTGAKTKIKPSQPKSNEPICKPICLKTFWIKKHFIEHFVVQNIPRNFFPGKQIFVAFTGHFFVQKLSLKWCLAKRIFFTTQEGLFLKSQAHQTPRPKSPTYPQSQQAPTSLTRLPSTPNSQFKPNQRRHSHRAPKPKVPNPPTLGTLTRN